MIAEFIVFKRQLTDEIHQAHAYLSNKWGLTAIVDSDNDGFTDAVEIAANTLATDANSIPMPDFTETVGAVINADDSDATGLAGVESSLALWLDASNVDGKENAGINDSSAISEWMDLSGNGNTVSAVTSKKSQLTQQVHSMALTQGLHLIMIS